MLVVVVAAMRVKVYKDRFKNLLLNNEEKEEHIYKIEKELRACKVRNTQQKQALAQFDDTKNTLQVANASYLSLQNTHDNKAKELAQYKAKLEFTEEMLEKLTLEHKNLKKRFVVILDENTKYKTTNVRLLTRLEAEQHHVQMLKSEIEE